MGNEGLLYISFRYLLVLPPLFLTTYFPFKRILLLELSNGNISGKNGSTELTYTPPARHLRISVFRCIDLLPLLRTMLFCGHVNLHFQSQPLKLTKNAVKLSY